MIFIAAVTIAALLASVVLTLVGWGAPVAVAHLAFAIGIVPLIFGAMIHFVPVLTRSGQPAHPIRLLPVGAQVAGAVAVAAMAGSLPREWLHGAAVLDFALAAALLGFIFRRVRRCLGSPHPGWRWYAGALSCLLAALAAVPALVSLPGYYFPLRSFHLHLNTLGMVGMAALGTLPVLLPTALGKPDPQAAEWLRRRMMPALLAVVAVALGAALAWPLALAGGLGLAILIMGLLRQWRQRFGFASLWADGPAASLALATVGLLALLGAGFLHGLGILPARPSIVAWGAGFLLPLVTGALSQLLPVWRWPGPAIPERGVMRSRLAATGRWRGLLFVTGGMLLAVGLPAPGGLAVAAGMLLFALGFVQAVQVKASAR